ncbi:MAG: tyrosine-type recombinase/integrase, partial [Phycisphaerales bacterium]
MSNVTPTRINWVLDPGKFLSAEDIERLVQTAKMRAERARAHGRRVAVRDYLIIDLALSTGLRVMEIAKLNCGDVFTRDDMSSLLVRRGKGGKTRLVRFNGAFRQHISQYIRWKQEIGEPTTPHAPLLLSSTSRDHMSTRAIQKAFKRTAARACLPPHFSIHCLRHTYACHLYKASGYNLRLV